MVVRITLLVLFLLTAPIAQGRMFTLRKSDRTFTAGCGYQDGEIASEALVSGGGPTQTTLGHVKVSIHGDDLVVKYTAKTGCHLTDAVHATVTDSPLERPVPGRFPCKEHASGTSKSLTCPLSSFSASCCGPKYIYTHGVITCNGVEEETVFAGMRSCASRGKWCNVIQIDPPCECGCDAAADKCKPKTTCECTGQAVCDPTDPLQFKQKSTCECTGAQVCDPTDPMQCTQKSTCECTGQPVCDPTDPAQCTQKSICECTGLPVCDPTDAAQCTQKSTCECTGQPVCDPADPMQCTRKPTCECTGQPVCDPADPMQCTQKSTCECTGLPVCDPADATQCTQKATCDCTGDSVCDPTDSTQCKQKTLCDTNGQQVCDPNDTTQCPPPPSCPIACPRCFSQDPTTCKCVSDGDPTCNPCPTNAEDSEGLDLGNKYCAFLFNGDNSVKCCPLSGGCRKSGGAIDARIDPYNAVNTFLCSDSCGVSCLSVAKDTCTIPAPIVLQTPGTDEVDQVPLCPGA